MISNHAHFDDNFHVLEQKPVTLMHASLLDFFYRFSEGQIKRKLPIVLLFREVPTNRALAVCLPEDHASTRRSVLFDPYSDSSAIDNVLNFSSVRGLVDYLDEEFEADAGFVTWLKRRSVNDRIKRKAARKARLQREIAMMKDGTLEDEPALSDEENVNLNSEATQDEEASTRVEGAGEVHIEEGMRLGGSLNGATVRDVHVEEAKKALRKSPREFPADLDRYILDYERKGEDGIFMKVQAEVVEEVKQDEYTEGVPGFDRSGGQLDWYLDEEKKNEGVDNGADTVVGLCDVRESEMDDREVIGRFPGTLEPDAYLSSYEQEPVSPLLQDRIVEQTVVYREIGMRVTSQEALVPKPEKNTRAFLTEFSPADTGESQNRQKPGYASSSTALVRQVEEATAAEDASSQDLLLGEASFGVDLSKRKQEERDDAEMIPATPIKMPSPPGSEEGRGLLWTETNFNRDHMLEEDKHTSNTASPTAQVSAAQDTSTFQTEVSAAQKARLLRRCKERRQMLQANRAKSEQDEKDLRRKIGLEALKSIAKQKNDVAKDGSSDSVCASPSPQSQPLEIINDFGGPPKSSNDVYRHPPQEESVKENESVMDPRGPSQHSLDIEQIGLVDKSDASASPGSQNQETQAEGSAEAEVEAACEQSAKPEAALFFVDLPSSPILKESTKEVSEFEGKEADITREQHSAAFFVDLNVSEDDNQSINRRREIKLRRLQRRQQPQYQVSAREVETKSSRKANDEAAAISKSPSIAKGMSRSQTIQTASPPAPPKRKAQNRSAQPLVRGRSKAFTNLKLIQNAVNHVALAGTNAASRRQKVLAAMKRVDEQHDGGVHYVLAFRKSVALQFRSIYVSVNSERTFEKIWGNGPDVLSGNKHVLSFLKYNTGQKRFEILTTLGFTKTTDAIVLDPKCLTRHVPHDEDLHRQ